MHILLVESSGRGFLSHYTHALALGMYRAGVKVQLLTGKRDELKGWTVPFHKQACLEDGGPGWHCIRRQVVEERPDVVHLQWVNNPLAAIRFVRWAQRRGVRVIYTPHNILPHERRWLLMPLYRILYRQLDRVVARDSNLAWALEEMLDMPQERVVNLPGSPNFLALNSEDSLHSFVPPKSDNEQRLLFFGHGCPRKGLDRLLAIVAEHEWPVHLHLVVAGEGVLNGVTRELAATASGKMRISVVDRYVAPQGVAAMFRDADLLLMPYIKLCKSPLLDLAAALRLPVLRSDRVQSADFRDGVHGVTFAHDDSAAFSRLLMERDWVDKAADNLRLLDDPVVTMDRLARGHERLYREVIAQCSHKDNKAVSISPIPQSR